MALRYPYADPYLAPHITGAREDAAYAAVSALGTLPDYWVERLTTLQAYLIACAECMKAADDVFSAKLGAYRKAYDLALPQARAAQRVADDAAGITPVGSGSLFTVDLQRG
jgi:hypothetical protein